MKTRSTPARRQSAIDSLMPALTLLGVACGVGLLSLISPSIRPTLGLGASLGLAANHVDHALAYAAVTCLTWLVITPRIAPVVTCRGFIAFAALMELSQTLSPGRTPKVSDFLTSSTGAVIGLAAAISISYLLRRAATAQITAAFAVRRDEPQTR